MLSFRHVFGAKLAPAAPQVANSMPCEFGHNLDAYREHALRSFLAFVAIANPRKTPPFSSSHCSNRTWLNRKGWVTPSTEGLVLRTRKTRPTRTAVCNPYSFNRLMYQGAERAMCHDHYFLMPSDCPCLHYSLSPAVSLLFRRCIQQPSTICWGT